jgi:hypothetical protein
VRIESDKSQTLVLLRRRVRLRHGAPQQLDIWRFQRTAGKVVLLCGIGLPVEQHRLADNGTPLAIHGETKDGHIRIRQKASSVDRHKGALWPIAVIVGSHAAILVERRVLFASGRSEIGIAPIGNIYC